MTVRALVKSAFMDKELNGRLLLTSANSINVARFLPQAFYYFHAYAQLKRAGRADIVVICSTQRQFRQHHRRTFRQAYGSARETRFIASNNRNDIFINTFGRAFIRHAQA